MPSKEKFKNLFQLDLDMTTKFCISIKRKKTRYHVRFFRITFHSRISFGLCCKIIEAFVRTLRVIVKSKFNLAVVSFWNPKFGFLSTYFDKRSCFLKQLNKQNMVMVSTCLRLFRVIPFQICSSFPILSKSR